MVILLAGDRVVARQVAGRKHGRLGRVCPCYSWAPRAADPRARGLWPMAFLEELFVISGFRIFLGAFPGLLGLARWEPVPGAGLLQIIPKDPVSPVRDEEHHCLQQETGITGGGGQGIRSLPLKQAHNYNASETRCKG